MSLLGQSAPDFTLPHDGGGEITLSNWRDQNVVLFFYPRDDTSGCTKEALNFTDRKSDFQNADTKIIGISKDSIAKHQKFIAKHSIGVTLVSDAESDTCEKYGVWVEKTMYGQKFMGIERTTFLIGRTGIILREWRKVKVPGHVEDVLSAARKETSMVS